MIDILSSIKEAAKESNAFENHAAKVLSLEDRLLYLQGLSLVMNADGEIRDVEKDYLLILIKSLELDESIIESCIDFATQPDKATIQSILKCFRRKPIAQLFLFDALMLSYRDDNISVQEKAVIDELACQFEVTKGIYNDIFDLFCYVKNKNWHECSLYFSMHLLNPEFFAHIFNYYDINLGEVSNESKKESKRKILACIKNKIANGITNEILVPFLQSKIDRREASVKNGFFILADLEDIDLSQLKLKYSQFDEAIHIESSCIIKDKSIVKFYFDSLGLNELERYKLTDGRRKILAAEIKKSNNRVLILDSKFEKDNLIEIKGILWRYMQGDEPNNILGSDQIISNKEVNFRKLEGLNSLQLHRSLTNKTGNGFLQGYSNDLRSGQLIRLYATNEQK
ncbi:hypothetical protein VA249_34180 [Vibrio alfacsensis]|uniref:tellurite resistance TerB family protein n=1 Tax=Vibrio alfacsensis TaxID=1074311 RepID=UPI001BEF22E2|nr:TerB family tellurite resistance protein [Vibrio alfacsensis]BBM66772.1 hypothetical protein VA249_34180 [Vibrio alfacsensis]